MKTRDDVRNGVFQAILFVTDFCTLVCYERGIYEHFANVGEQFRKAERLFLMWENKLCVSLDAQTLIVLKTPKPLSPVLINVPGICGCQ